MLIYGKEVDFKISRLSNASAMELALEKMEKDENEIKKMPKNAGVAKVIAAFITMFRNFFLNATGMDVLEGCDDMEDAKKAYMEFLSAIKEQKTVMLSPYDPDGIE